MTTVVWNQARSAQKSYKTPQPPRELSAEGIGRAISTSDNACKTCGYVIHKDGCPDRPRGEGPGLFVEPRIYQVPGERVFLYPPIARSEHGQTHNPNSEAFSLNAPVDLQPAVYTQAQFDAMREQLVGEVMRQKTIAANVASMVVRSRTELQQLRHESAMLQMERDRMNTRPDFMWNDKARAFDAVRYGTPADETRLAERLQQLRHAEAKHVERIQMQRQAAEAQRLVAQARAGHEVTVQSTMAQVSEDDLDRYRRLLYGDPAPQPMTAAEAYGYAPQTIVHKAKATSEEAARFLPEHVMTAAEATQKYEEWLVRNHLK